MVSSTPRLHFTPGKDPVPIVQEAGWDPGPVWNYNVINNSAVKKGKVIPLQARCGPEGG